MTELAKTIKLHIHMKPEDRDKLVAVTEQYRDACNYASQYVFDHGFPLNYVTLHNAMYRMVRSEFGLKSQFAISVMKTVVARYKTVREQMDQRPYRYQDENGTWKKIPRTLEWMTRPVTFRRPQADFVRNRDYSFITKDGRQYLSLNTMEKRVHVTYDVPEVFWEYLYGQDWKFGGGKLVYLNGEWYFHISVAREIEEFSAGQADDIVGIDRGLRFLATIYDGKGKTSFMDGRQIMRKRDAFQAVRSELQAKGTKSAKRALKRVSGRENRWMNDVNHRLTKTLVQEYGPRTLFVLEDLTGVSFSEKNLGYRTAKGRQNLRTWSFYQFEQFLTYKAHETGSEVIAVQPDYTSQRCPKCGRIRKENRHHETHEYVCDCCGYRSNDDRIGAMNIRQLGIMYRNGNKDPKFCMEEAG